ncbi:MAG: hypothetical protein L0G69_16540 [Brevibacterium sp.]|nr:hypothetical protein [Brevibacterium sp.]
MQRMMLDENNNGKFQVVEVAPRVDRDGVQRTNRDNVNQWELELLHRPADGGKSGVTIVRVTSTEEPSFKPMEEVRLKGFQAFHWEMGDRSGVSLSAEEAAPVSRGNAPQSSQPTETSTKQRGE